jgi:hypothetical protein
VFVGVDSKVPKYYSACKFERNADAIRGREAPIEVKVGFVHITVVTSGFYTFGRVVFA